MKDKGITLVALVITIIILLILAGITISQLTGSGLFENAKLAEEKSKNAQEKEDSILADYEQQIANARETITIDKDEYEKLKSKGTMVLLASLDQRTDYTQFTVSNLKEYSSFIFQVADSKGIFESVQFSYDDLKSTEGGTQYIRLCYATDIIAKLYYESDVSIKMMHTQSIVKLYGIK